MGNIVLLLSENIGPVYMRVICRMYDFYIF